MKAATILCAFAGCTYPAKEFSEPFACLGEARPTTASAQVRLTGPIIDPQSMSPVSGVQITLLDQNLGTIEGPETANGAYDVSLPTGGRPIERVYIKGEATGYMTAFQTNSTPLAGNVTSLLPLVSLPNAGAVAVGSIGAPSFPTDQGVLFMSVLDCNGVTLADAVVSTTPPGQAFYFDGFMASMTRTATDPVGVAMVTGLPPGNVTLTVTVDGMQFPAHQLAIVAGAFTQFDVTPFTP